MRRAPPRPFGPPGPGSAGGPFPAARAATAVAAALVALAAGAGCGRKAPHPPPERYVPADAPAAISVPALGTASRQVGALYRTVARAPPAAQLGEAHAAVRAQLGFDPLDPRGLEQAGVDPAAGAAAALGDGRPPLLVLPVLDVSRLDATLARLARDRLGAADRVATKAKGLEVVVFRRDAGSPPALSYAVAGPHAVVSAGAQGAEAVAAAASMPEERSLARSPTWRRAREAVGDGYLVTVVVPPGSPAAADVRAARDGAALGVRCDATTLGLRLALLLAPDREDWWKGLRPEGTAPAPPDGVAALPEDAVLVLRWAGDPAAARRLLPWLPPDAARSLAAAGVDVERDLLPALGPGAALSLSLAPTFTVAEFSSPRFDVRRTDPFRVVRLEASLPVRDAARLRAVLGRLQKAAPRTGVKVAPRGPGGAPTGWTLTWGTASLGLSLAGDRLLAAGGADRLQGLEARAASGAGYAPPTPPAREALGGGLGGAVLDVGHLVLGVAALPEEAYGTGPNAFVMRSLVGRYLEPAQSLATVSARLDLAPGAAVVDVEVVGRPPPVAPAEPAPPAKP
jgi:hypothetical protein